MNWYSYCPRLFVRPLLGVCILWTLAPTGVYAAEKQPPAVQQLKQHGIEVVRSFPAVSGLTGWVIKSANKYSILYSTADGKTLINGGLMDQHGQNLSAVFSDKYIPKPDYSKAYDDLAQAGFVSEGVLGGPKKVIYVFFDPNCPFCHLTWLALKPYLQVGLQARWIPVAYLRESSLGKAAAMLEAKEQVPVFEQIMENFGKPDSEYESMQISDSTRKRIDDNTTLWQRFELTGTPAMVWKDETGKVQVLSGMPKLGMLPIITGLPEQPHKDPRLARFR